MSSPPPPARAGAPSSAEEALRRLPLSDRLRRRVRRDVVGPLRRHLIGPLYRLRNRRRDYRPVFVAGAMGSGTTLLALSLGQRFDCACVIEEGAIQIAESSFLHVPGFDRFESIRAYQDFLRPRPDWYVERGRAAMLDLYRSYARGPSDVVFDKGPNAHLVRVPFLDRCFPEARWVMIFRDPVANVEGFRRKWSLFARDPLEESVRFYREIHETFLVNAAALGERVSVVRYEDLVERYEDVLGALGRRLGLEAARGSRRLWTRANFEGQGIRNVSRNQIGVVRSANEAARRRLSPSVRELVERSLDPLHEQMRGLALRP